MPTLASPRNSYVPIIAQYGLGAATTYNKHHYP